MDVNRRCFLQRASQAAVISGLMSPLSALGGRSPTPIVDTHQHLWDLTRLKLTWLSPPLDRSFTLEDYVQATQGLHVVQAVYMEVAAPRQQRMEEAQYVIGLCRQPRGLTRAAVLAGSPTDEDFVPYVTQFKGNPCVKGFRGALAARRTGDEQVVKHLRWLGELGMRFDLNVSPPSLAEAARLVDRCPGTRFVLDHCGNPDPVAFFPAGRAAPRPPQHAPEQWKQDISRLGAKANVICKISGLVSRVPEVRLTAEDLAPIINHCLEAFGPDRAVFAGDWPVCLRGMPLRDWITLLKAVVADRSEQDQRKLFHDNAVKFYDLV